MGTANPPNRFTQAEALALAGYTDERRRGFFLNSGIEGRYHGHGEGSRPALAEWLVWLLSRRPDLATLLMAAIGDLIPAQQLNPLGLLARLLAQRKPPGTSPG